jgi:hypothetical protein
MPHSGYTEVSNQRIDDMLRNKTAVKAQYYLAASGEMFLGTWDKRVRVTDTAKTSLYFKPDGNVISVQQAIDDLNAAIPTFNFITAIADTNSIDLNVALEVLTADLKFQNSATINLSVNALGLQANLVVVPPALIPLTDTHIFVGNAVNVATDVPASGDVANVKNTGDFTIIKYRTSFMLMGG